MRILCQIFFIFILACASRPIPEWVTSLPKEEGYWFGIGTVQKLNDGNDCRDEARNKALQDISAQISIEITGSFEQMVTEHNLTLDKFSKSVIQTRVDQTLPMVENMDFYDSKEQCSFLARLSQSIYYETIERQRRNAVQSALGLLAQAESGFNVQTFTYLSAAISEIVPYLDIPIEEEYPSGSGKRVNLYRYIKVVANKYINRITLLPDKKNLEIKRGFTRDLQLSVRVIDNTDQSPIVDIPVICYMTVKGENISALSNSEGNCIFSMPPLTDNNSIQYINYVVNKADILRNLEYFGTISKIQAQSTVQINSPQIYINIIENILGDATVNPYIQPVISEFFARYFSAKFVDNDDADLIIRGMVNTRSVSDTPNEYRFV